MSLYSKVAFENNFSRQISRWSDLNKIEKIFEFLKCERLREEQIRLFVLEEKWFHLKVVKLRKEDYQRPHQGDPRPRILLLPVFIEFLNLLPGSESVNMWHVNIQKKQTDWLAH